jgi:hypothetical protein
MKTYKALIKAQVGDQIKAVPTEIRAQSAVDAKWLLQAIYGFHALVSSPIEVKSAVAEENSQMPKQPLTPEKARIASLRSAKEHASDALQTEKDRQKRAKAIDTLQSI